MFLDVVDTCFSDIKRCEREILNDESMDTLTKIREIMSVMPEKYRNKGLSNLYVLKDKFPSIYSKVSTYLSTDWDATIELLERAMDEGIIRRVQIPVIKSMVESTLAEFMGNTVLVENGIAYEDAMNEMIDIIINGIKANN
jgi:hypothetical protein